MKEKDMQTLWGKYLKTHRTDKTEVYELKIVKQTSMPFSRVNEHQIVALNQARKGNFYYKISDTGFPTAQDSLMRFTPQKPFDCMNIFKADAYVVIWFYKPRQKKKFILIGVRSFVEEVCSSDRKSLTEERAREIATKVIGL